MIHASKNNLTRLDLFNEDGDIHYSQAICSDHVPGITVEYTVDCPANQVAFLTHKNFLRGNEKSGYGLYMDFCVSKKQLESFSPSRNSELFESVLRVRGREPGFHLEAKLIAQKSFLDKKYAIAYVKQQRKAKKCHGRMPGSPRGFEANADHISGAIPNLPPLEGGLCCPK